MPAHQPGRRRVAAVDVGIAGLTFAVSLGLLSAGQADFGHSGDVSAAGVGLSAVATLPVIWRRQAPLVVFGLTGFSGVALRLVASPVGPPLGAAVALYTVAASKPRLARSVMSVVAFVFVAYLAATAVAAGPARSRELALAVLGWGGAWLAGERTRLRSEQIAELEDRARRIEHDRERERRLAVAEERMRIARDLHDSAGHAISVILIHAGDGRLRVRRDPGGAHTAFETIEQVARETAAEIDQLVRVLRDQTEDRAEPPPGVAALDALLARHRDAGLKITATVTGPRLALPAAIDQSAYRILQEALTNAARHGDGQAQIELRFRADALELTITNRLGQARRAGAGHGIVGMRERAATLGGSVSAETVDGRFEVRAWLPTII